MHRGSRILWLRARRWGQVICNPAQPLLCAQPVPEKWLKRLEHRRSIYCGSEQKAAAKLSASHSSLCAAPSQSQKSSCKGAHREFQAYCGSQQKVKRFFSALCTPLSPLQSPLNGYPFVSGEDKYAPQMPSRKGSNLSLSNPGIHLPQLIMGSETTAIFSTSSLFLTWLHKLGFLPFPAPWLPNPPIQGCKPCFSQIHSFQMWILFPYSYDGVPSFSK